MPFSAAIDGGRTVHTLFSGPAAGAQASAYLAKDDAQQGLVTLDMGGTSLRHRLHRGRRAARRPPRASIARRQVDVPALDMTTISAGGGSIACDRRRRLSQRRAAERRRRSGPGLLRPRRHAADRDRRRPGLRLSQSGLFPRRHADARRRGRARRAASARSPSRSSMGVLDAAAGIRRIVDMRMADEVRVFAAKRGVDLSAFTLLPFGGAGAVHAAAVAEELGMRRILVPARPGAFSALGLLCTDVVHDYIRSELRPLADVGAGSRRGHLSRNSKPRRATSLRPRAWTRRRRTLRARARPALHRPGLRTAHAARRACSPGGSRPTSLTAARERFDERHAQIHGHAARERPVEVVSYRLRVRVAVPKYQPREERPPPPRAPPAERGQGHAQRPFRRPSATATPRSTSATGSTSAHHRRACHRRAIRRHHRHPARLDRAGRRTAQSDSGARR